MSFRVGATTLIACAVLGLAGCASSATATGSGSLSGTDVSPAPSPAGPTSTPSPTPAPVVTVTVTKALPAALTCDELKHALVGSTTISYNGYHDSIPLGDGVWSGEDGNTVTLQDTCGIGDLDGDGAADAVGVVVLTSGGSGQFYTLVVWHNGSAKPVFTALADLGDRNPVQSITIAGGKATVVYLTRTSDAPMAEVNIKRTAIYKLSGHHFTEQSHTDEPYTAS
jgi:hypothetical protein